MTSDLDKGLLTKSNKLGAEIIQHNTNLSSFLALVERLLQYNTLKCNDEIYTLLHKNLVSCNKSIDSIRELACKLQSFFILSIGKDFIVMLYIVVGCDDGGEG